MAVVLRSIGVEALSGKHGLRAPTVYYLVFNENPFPLHLFSLQAAAMQAHFLSLSNIASPMTPRFTVASHTNAQYCF